MFRKSGFELKRSFVRTIGTAELDAEQQSILSQALQGPLYKELARFEKKEFPKLMKKYKEIVAIQGAQSDVAQAFMREKITSRITQIHYKVKDTVIKRTPQLINDPRIQEALERKEEFNRSISTVRACTRLLQTNPPNWQARLKTSWIFRLKLWHYISCDDARDFYEGNGVQKEYEVTFEYYRKEDVSVAFWDEETLLWETSLTLNGSGNMRLRSNSTLLLHSVKNLLFTVALI